jgi:hypothetical protein
MVELLVEAEGGRCSNPEGRVWAFTFEVPKGTWGGDLRDGLGPRVIGLPDIAEHVVGEPGRRYLRSASPSGDANRAKVLLGRSRR